MCHTVDYPALSEKPFKLVSELTYKCNLKCIYCHNPVNKYHFNNELTTKQWKTIISEAADLGVVINELTGGEPTLRKDLIELINHSKELGLYTKINTNGSTITDVQASKLHESGLDAAQVGFPSLDKVTHKKITNADELLDKRIRGVINLRKYDIPVYLNVVLTKFNYLEIEAIIKFAEEYKISEVVFQPAFLFGSAAINIRNGNNFLPSQKQMDIVQSKLSELRASELNVKLASPNMFYYTGEPMPCSWNKEGVIVVTPNGLLTPCEPASSLYPEVKFESTTSGRNILDIWNNSPALEMFEDTNLLPKLPKICNECEILNLCRGGCRVVTYLLTDNVFLEDPTCSLSENRGLVKL